MAVISGILHFQTVLVSGCNNRWSWKVAETKTIIQVSAAPASFNQERNASIQLSDIIYLPIDGAEAEQGEEKEENEGVTEEVVAEDETWFELLKEPEEQENQKNSDGKRTPANNREEFQDQKLIPEIVEETEENPKEKSICRRFLTWLDGLIHDHYREKITETYRREQEEGHQFYRTNFYFFYPMTRAQRERQKREKWLSRDKQRQSIKRCLDAYWEKKHEEKESLRKEEEERYERWAADHNLLDSPLQGPKRRMGLWERRFLLAKEFLFH